jgi:hypothetical protein
MKTFLRIETDIRKGIFLNIIFMIVGCVLLYSFFTAANQGYYSSEKMFLRHGNMETFHFIITLTLGPLFILLPLYLGINPQKLIVNDNGILYNHGFYNKQILWTDVSKIKALGFNKQGEESFWGVEIEDINKSSINAINFENHDLQKFMKLAYHKSKSLKYKIVKDISML